MSIPPNPPANSPANQPHQPPMSWRNKKRMGAIAAVVSVVFLSLLIGLANPSPTSSGSNGTLVKAALISPLLALIAVVGGAFGTMSERYRRFAVGFLIASAVLIFVTAGTCLSVISSAGMI